MGVERPWLYYPGCIQTASGPRGLGGSAPPTEVPFGAEVSSPSQDEGIRLAPATTAPDDEVPAAAHCLESPIECLQCARVVEDCPHLFFACPLAQAMWQEAGVGRLVVTLQEVF